MRIGSKCGTTSLVLKNNCRSSVFLYREIYLPCMEQIQSCQIIGYSSATPLLALYDAADFTTKWCKIHRAIILTDFRKASFTSRRRTTGRQITFVEGLPKVCKRRTSRPVSTLLERSTEISPPQSRSIKSIKGKPIPQTLYVTVVTYSFCCADSVRVLVHSITFDLLWTSPDIAVNKSKLWIRARKSKSISCICFGIVVTPKILASCSPDFVQIEPSVGYSAFFFHEIRSNCMERSAVLCPPLALHPPLYRFSTY